MIRVPSGWDLPLRQYRHIGKAKAAGGPRIVLTTRSCAGNIGDPGRQRCGGIDASAGGRYPKLAVARWPLHCLGARGETPATFKRRCIPPERRCSADCVSPRSGYGQYAPSSRLVSRAPRRSRCYAGFHHGLLAATPGSGIIVRQPSPCATLTPIVQPTTEQQIDPPQLPLESGFEAGAVSPYGKMPPTRSSGPIPADVQVAFPSVSPGVPATCLRTSYRERTRSRTPGSLGNAAPLPRSPRFGVLAYAMHNTSALRCIDMEVLEWQT